MLGFELFRKMDELHHSDLDKASNRGGECAAHNEAHQGRVAIQANGLRLSPTKPVMAIKATLLVKKSPGKGLTEQGFCWAEGAC